MSEKPHMSATEAHSAGAVVIHASPFESLPVSVDYGSPPGALIDRWVRPFYHACLTHPAETEVPLRESFATIDENLVRQLLTYFNWRPRVVGAFFAGLKEFVGVTDEIGRLLLRSDVCYAGRAYCVALARFNTPAAVQYLREYLEYYLRRPDLWFDQQVALAALQFLDQKNRTSYAPPLLPIWEDFVANKPNWDLAGASRGFATQLESIDQLLARLQRPDNKALQTDGAPRRR
jgi:Family of unknown function (DUF6000)